MRSLAASLLIHLCLALLSLAAWKSVPPPPTEIPVELRLTNSSPAPAKSIEKARPAPRSSTPSPVSKAETPAANPSGSLASSNDNALTGPGAPAEEYEVSELPLLLNEVRIPYPPEARTKRIQGAVVFDLVISSSGDVASFRVLQSPGAGLSEAASNAIRKFKFKPARIGDKSVAIRIRYTYRFMIE